MKKLFALLFMTVVTMMSLSAQRTITGTIIDEDGVPLIGANVLVKGTTIGTIADIDGSYSLEIPSDSEVMVYSYTGYISQEVVLGSSNVIDITLELNSEIIDEVLVVGYRDQSKPKSNVASQVISAATIEARPNASLVQTLQGQVAGLNITTSNGQPGANSEINLRGVSSINGNTEPLFIIDGTPVDEDNFRSLNPNEIEKIDVLKDAGATAIYGNRGANGVIVIKTKTGSYNTGLGVKYSVLVGQASRQSDDYNLMNAQELLRLERDYGTGRGVGMTDSMINSTVGTDWLDFFFRNPITQQHNLSVTTGGELFNSYINLGFMDQQGILEASGLKRYNFRTNVGMRSKDNKFNLSFSNSLNYSYSDEPNSIGTGAINRNFILGAYSSAPYISIDEYVDGRGLLSPLVFSNTPLFLYDRLLTYTRYEKEIKAISSMNASYKLTDNLTFRSVIGADFTDQNLVRAEGPESFNALLFAQQGNTTPGFQQQANTRVFSYNWLNSLSYTKTVNDLHTFNAGVYTEYFRAYYDFFSFFNEGLDPRTFFPGDGDGFVDDNAANDYFVDDVDANKLYAGLFSYFGSLDYDYNSKYGIGLTLRRDASFRFAESNRWGTFYSISGRWNLDQESFMDGSPFDLLKLRGSWGVTGNQRIVDSGGFLNYFGGPDLTLDLFSTGSGYAGLNSLSPSQLGNLTLKWETVEQANIGIDFELFRSRLRGYFDYYVKTTKDLFQDRPVSAITSETVLRANIGSLRNSGFDLYLAYDVLDSSNGLNLELFFNTNYNKQNIIDLPTPDGQIINDLTILREGSILNEFYVYRYVGVNPANGNLLFLDANDQLTENPSPDSDRIPLGINRYPDYFGSFGANLSYKGAYLELQFNYTKGVYRFDFDYESAIDPTSIGQYRLSKDLERAWSIEDPDNLNLITDIPALRATNLSLDDSSDRFLQSADYVRLRFVRAGYAFPKSMLTSGIKNLRVYALAENILTFTGWRGYDAESTISTGSRNYPTPKIVSVGLEVEF